MPTDAPQGIPDARHFCQFCGDDADHKCGDGDACGGCCAMLGGLAETDSRAYKWIYDYVLPGQKRIRSETMSGVAAELRQRARDWKDCDPFAIADWIEREARRIK